MSLLSIHHEQELDQVLAQDNELLLAFLIDDSQASTTAREALEKALALRPEGHAYAVNARTVRNAASRFGVTAVPTVLRMRQGQTVDKLVGPQSQATYAALLAPSLSANNKPTEDATKRVPVKVYVTNTCPWCRRLESYLDQHQVRYTKVNVQNDPAAAHEMQRKSGQLGVPQADIGGQMVVGFDKARIDKLLNLR